MNFCKCTSYSVSKALNSWHFVLKHASTKAIQNPAAWSSNIFFYIIIERGTTIYLRSWSLFHIWTWQYNFSFQQKQQKSYEPCPLLLHFFLMTQYPFQQRMPLRQKLLSEITWKTNIAVKIYPLSAMCFTLPIKMTTTAAKAEEFII